MQHKEFIDNLLREICSDERIKNGTFSVENPQHLSVLREYLGNILGEENAEELMDTLNSTELEEGNYPERQAYNKDGVLVTFPDPESKKAAMDRGTHFEDPPGGLKTDDGEETPDDEDTPNLFDTTETPEQRIQKQKEKSALSMPGTEIDPENIELSDKNPENEKHRLYDILAGIKRNDIGDEGESLSDEFELNRLDPTVLFALKEKWTFDKSGDWYDEFGKFKGDTDLRGKVNPAKDVDNIKMEQWVADYHRRQAGIEPMDQMDMEI